MAKKGPTKESGILLLESSEETVKIYQALFSKLSIPIVDWVPSGFGWAAIWQAKRPFLTIIDLQLPKRDGLDCIAKLKGIDRETKVLFTHPYQGTHANVVELQAFARGASTVMQKPFQTSRFLVTIYRILSQIEQKK